VDIFDVLRPKLQSLDAYEKSLQQQGEESYESRNPEFFEPDRIVFLDGVLQSRRSGDAAYHEALVHPALFTHPNPIRVAIIGGGEGATLREVLKHKTVEKVVMVEIDEEMVRLSRHHLPFWSDCSAIVGSSKSCFDDPRAEIHFTDAYQWFIDRFSTDGDSPEEPFDVIIMDALYVSLSRIRASSTHDVKN
jgi:spermidine synthase